MRARKATIAGKESYKCGQGKADKKWHKSRQGKVQRRKEKYKGRPEKVQVVQVQDQQARKTNI